MQRPSTILLNESGTDPFPFFKDAWTLYSKKGNKTVFVSIGASKSAIADLEIAETIGCPLIVVPCSATGLTGWVEVAQCIKTHEPFENPKSDFSVGADEKWIIPKNLRIEAASMPWWHSGTVKQSPTYCLEGVTFYDWVQDKCKMIGLPPEDTRIDILKIDTADGTERSLIYAALDAGFRPSTLIVNWTVAPDSDMPTKMAAGHLQNCGYVLIRKEFTKFLYYFVDSDLYSACSWENVNVVNPLVDELVNQVKASLEAPVLTEEGTAPMATPSNN